MRIANPLKLCGDISSQCTCMCSIRIIRRHLLGSTRMSQCNCQISLLTLSRQILNCLRSPSTIKVLKCFSVTRSQIKSYALVNLVHLRNCFPLITLRQPSQFTCFKDYIYNNKLTQKQTTISLQ